MVSEEEIKRKGDEYVQRLRARRKEQDDSFQYRSKSLHRRKSIINAIGEKNATCPDDFVSNVNPFEKEFGTAKRSRTMDKPSASPAKSSWKSREARDSPTNLPKSSQSNKREQPERLYSWPENPPVAGTENNHRRASQTCDSLFAARRIIVEDDKENNSCDSPVPENRRSSKSRNSLNVVRNIGPTEAEIRRASQSRESLPAARRASGNFFSSRQPRNSLPAVKRLGSNDPRPRNSLNATKRAIPTENQHPPGQAQVPQQQQQQQQQHQPENNPNPLPVIVENHESRRRSSQPREAPKEPESTPDRDLQRLQKYRELIIAKKRGDPDVDQRAYEQLQEARFDVICNFLSDTAADIPKSRQFPLRMPSCERQDGNNRTPQPTPELPEPLRLLRSGGLRPVENRRPSATRQSLNAVRCVLSTDDDQEEPSGGTNRRDSLKDVKVPESSGKENDQADRSRDSLDVDKNTEISRINDTRNDQTRDSLEDSKFNGDGNEIGRDDQTRDSLEENRPAELGVTDNSRMEQRRDSLEDTRLTESSEVEAKGLNEVLEKSSLPVVSEDAKKRNLDISLDSLQAEVGISSNLLESRDTNRLPESISTSEISPSEDKPRNVEEDRLSFSEYFADPYNKKIGSQVFLKDDFEEEFARGNAELQRKGPDLFFGARVLEVIEPEIVDKESLDAGEIVNATYIQDKPAGLQQNLDDSTSCDATSFKSEDIRDLDREIDKLQLQPNVEDALDREMMEYRKEVPRTPRPTSDNVGLARIVQGNRTSTLLREDGPAINYKAHAEGVPVATSELDLSSKSGESTRLEHEIYGTPMPISNSEMRRLKRREYVNRQECRLLEERNAVAQEVEEYFDKLLRKNQQRPLPNHESTRNLPHPFAPGSPLDSTISTLTLPNTPRSLHNVAEEDEVANAAATYLLQRGIGDSHIPDVVRNFLRDALGNDHYCSTTTVEQSHIKNHEIFTDVPEEASEASHYRTPTNSSTSGALVNQSHNGKFGKFRTLGRSFSKRLKRKFRKRVNGDDPDSPQSNHLAMERVSPGLQKKIKELITQLEVQQTLMSQAKKALELCHSLPEFRNSAERVESERALLLASLRHQLYQDEIIRLTSEHPERERAFDSRADLILSELSLQMREGILRRERYGERLVEWFLLVLSEGQRLWASRAVVCSGPTGRLHLAERFVVPELRPDFRLAVQVYGLQLQPSLCHEQRHLVAPATGLNSSSGRHHCPSLAPQRLWRHLERGRPRAAPTRPELGRNSSFVLCGELRLGLPDLASSAPWPLSSVARQSPLLGSIDMGLRCNLRLEARLVGFVTLGEEAGGLANWSRRWARLQQARLLFWNYPSDMEDCKPPVRTIDLARCAARSIDLIDRELCPRPRTLLVPTARPRDHLDEDNFFTECRGDRTIVRHLLSFDTPQELQEWQTQLNQVVTALHEWNIINLNF